MSKLSPTAKAVLDAALPVYDDEYLYVATMEKHAGMIAAAAIKAVADQVVPQIAHPDAEVHPDAEEWLEQSTWIQVESRVRSRILAIASELERQ